jgi:hypothetical protein
VSWLNRFRFGAGLSVEAFSLKETVSLRIAYPLFRRFDLDRIF